MHSPHDGEFINVTYASRRAGTPLLPAHPWLALSSVLFLVGCPVATGLLGAFGDTSECCNRASITRARIRSGLNGALDIYRARVGAYPARLSDLLAAPGGPHQRPRWRGPYAKSAEALNDDWGNPLIYAYPGIRNPAGYDLSSPGPDGRPGTPDDIP